MPAQSNILTGLVALVLRHISSFIAFFGRSQDFELQSSFDLPESIERLLALNGPRPHRLLDRLFACDGQRIVCVYVSLPRRPERNPFRNDIPLSSNKLALLRKISVVCAHHHRSNILHLFTGHFEEEETGRYILRGQIGLDPGIRIVLGFFCIALLLVLPIDVIVHRGSIWKAVEGMMVFLIILESCYLFGKRDDAIIARSLSQALAPETKVKSNTPIHL